MILAVFVSIFALMYRGGLHVESENMEKVMSLDEKLAIVLLLLASALISAFLDNIPFVATLIPMIQTMQQGGHGCAAPVVGPVPGRLSGRHGSLIGASANVVLAGVSAKNGYPITFMSYLKKGFPLMLLSVAICTVYLLIRFA